MILVHGNLAINIVVISAGRALTSDLSINSFIMVVYEIGNHYTTIYKPFKSECANVRNGSWCLSKHAKHFLILKFGWHKSFWWGHWYSCFRLLVTSPLGFKATVGSHIHTWWRQPHYTLPVIHLLCYTCCPLGGQHCCWADLFHIPATRHWWGSNGRPIPSLLTAPPTALCRLGYVKLVFLIVHHSFTQKAWVKYNISHNTKMSFIDICTFPAAKTTSSFSLIALMMMESTLLAVKMSIVVACLL